MSRIGVPSMASRPRTRSVVPSMPSSSQVDIPRRFGRFLARWAKMPTAGHSGLPRGTRAPVWTVAGSTRWKR